MPLRISQRSHDGHHSIAAEDLALLHLLTASADFPSASTSYGSNGSLGASGKRKMDRRPPVDPLMVAAAISASPDTTRNHYLHEFFPQKQPYSSCDVPEMPPRSVLKSKQAPRRVRLAAEEEERKKNASENIQKDGDKLNGSLKLLLPPQMLTSENGLTPDRPSSSTKRRRPSSVSEPAVAKALRQITTPINSYLPLSTMAEERRMPGLSVKCHARTRIPTPHGQVFLHLYKNNKDGKEHLAFVADHAQLDEEADVAESIDSSTSRLPNIRSKSLDAKWHRDETEMERIVRGAYIGRLSTTHVKSSSTLEDTDQARSTPVDALPQIVRIHSECFTGETIGSQRCDCGEQLDEAFRLINTAGRGIIVYLRQEGRGIGLLEKLRAYNLQDLGHDTVTANMLLGHGTDLRTYDIAGAILEDLGVRHIRLLTNNPDKIEQIEREGVTVVERVPMVPRAWSASPRKARRRNGTRRSLQETAKHVDSRTTSPEGDNERDDSSEEESQHHLRRAGVAMIGTSVTRSTELEKYLKTKVVRMGHMLEVPPTPPQYAAQRKADFSTNRGSSSDQEPRHPLVDSIVSLTTDVDSLGCGDSCSQCGATGSESD